MALAIPHAALSFESPSCGSAVSNNAVAVPKTMKMPLWTLVFVFPVLHHAYAPFCLIFLDLFGNVLLGP